MEDMVEKEKDEAIEENSDEKNKVTDESLLFPDVKIDGILIKPWSFGMLFEIAPDLEKVLEKAEQKGIPELFGANSINYFTIARLFAIASDELLSVISVTTGKTVEEIKNLKMETGVQIAFTIYLQNRETIKNALIPLL